jgi:hypothetical protein
LPRYGHQRSIYYWTVSLAKVAGILVPLKCRKRRTSVQKEKDVLGNELKLKCTKFLDKLYIYAGT